MSFLTVEQSEIDKINQPQMIYITQLVYINNGEESTFLRFEELVLPILSKHNGRLLLRLRPAEGEIVEAAIEVPYEIHFVTFQTDLDFENFKHDPERTKFLHMKDQSIRSVLLIKGSQI